MTIKVLVCDPIQVELLRLGDGYEVDYRPEIGRDELLASVSSYQVLIVRSRTKVDGEVLDAATSLRLIVRPGTGLDNVDVDRAKSKGVTVFNSPESLVEAVAEHVTLLMLALSRKLVEADEATLAGEWTKQKLMGSELKGKTLGIVGLGRIGRRIGEIASVLGMSILAYDVIPIPTEVLRSMGGSVSDLEGVFGDSDYVTLHVPLTSETKHLVDSARIASMKRTAFIINTSRGGVVDERALAEALRTGVIAGAGLDVFEEEPPSGPILSAPNVILTPHIAGQTIEAQESAVSAIGDKVRAFFLTS
ncbi:MAG TPA: hydroxyacid dehydrogenase [Nitrososphaerales archaeon]|nr:hydroxyacid dehydrogenase [Nitrososphaerales archaeon]